MARKIYSSKLDTRGARARLKVRGKPYFAAVLKGVAIGYRKSASGGMWCDRVLTSGTKDYVTETFAQADDTADADGVFVLTWDQAVNAVRERRSKRAVTAAGGGPYTVARAFTDWGGGKNRLKDSATRVELVPDWFKTLDANTELSTEKLTELRDELVSRGRGKRAREGQPQRFDPRTATAEEARKAKDSANKVMTLVKAALNKAFKKGKINSDVAWKRYEPFEGVAAAKIDYFTQAQVKALLAACPGDFGQLVTGALVTGARYNELCKMRVKNFSAANHYVSVSELSEGGRASKSGKARFVFLTAEGVKFFAGLTTGRDDDAYIFVQNDGQRWTKNMQIRRMADACEAAGIKKRVTFHTTRHTYASLAVMGGATLLAVAQNLGHSDTRMVVEHYGHLSPDYIAAQMREKAPTFDLESNALPPPT
jgi:integrase